MILCNAVLVKFVNQRDNNVEVRAKQSLYADHLRVTRDANYITVDYISKLGYIIKQINFEVNNVREYMCEEVQPPKPVVEKN